MKLIIQRRTEIVLHSYILIAQGNKAHEAIFFSVADISTQSVYLQIERIHGRIHAVQVNSHPLVYIQSVYPSWRNDRTRKQENKLFPYYQKAVIEFAK